MLEERRRPIRLPWKRRGCQNPGSAGAPGSVLLGVAEAQTAVLDRVQPLPPHVMPLAPAVLGLVLAEDVASDLDMPPYDKSLMDGYAVRATDLAAGQGELQVVEEITAGRLPQRPL